MHVVISRALSVFYRRLISMSYVHTNTAASFTDENGFNVDLRDFKRVGGRGRRMLGERSKCPSRGTGHVHIHSRGAEVGGL